MAEPAEDGSNVVNVDFTQEKMTDSSVTLNLIQGRIILSSASAQHGSRNKFGMTN